MTVKRLRRVCKTFLLLASVVQRVDNALHWINRSPVDNAVILLTVIRWIVIYPLDSVIHPLKNWTLMFCVSLRCGWFASKIFVFLSGYRSYFCFIQKGE